MERIDMKAAAVGVLLVFAISWFFDLEVLFLLGVVVVIAMSAVIALMVGAMTLAERLHTLTVAEGEKWSEVRPQATRQSVTG